MRQYPEFNFPLPRAWEQYDRAVQLALVAQKMSDFGTRVDTGKMLTLAREADARAVVFTDLLLELTGLPKEALGKSGEGQTDKVKGWFSEAGAPPVVFDKDSGKPQFNATALTCWAQDFGSAPFAAPAAALLGMRKAMVAARFARAYYAVASRYEGRIHFAFNTIGTKGERWSASSKFRWVDESGVTVKYSLNAQNVPSKVSKYNFGEKYGWLPLQVSLRSGFIPDEGCVWLKFDYEGAEAAILAYTTGDKALLEWINTEADIHTENAKVLFPELKIPDDLRKIGKEHSETWQNARVAAKGMIYALSYQAPSKKGEDKYPESYKAVKQVFPNTSEVYFNELTKRFFQCHTGIRAWQNEIARKVADDGYTSLAMTGKTIYVQDSSKGRNRAQNFPMQSGLGGLINRAIPAISDLCTYKRGEVAMMLMVHDEVDLQAPMDRVDEIDAAVSALLQQPADFGGHVAGIPAAPDVGENWGECKPRKK